MSQLAADWKAEPGQGEYVMYASDCLACRTAEGGEPFAGGRPIASPMGTIWATNIIPDPATGIGGWTLDQFRAALYDGLRAGTNHRAGEPACIRLEDRTKTASCAFLQARLAGFTNRNAGSTP